MNNLINGYGFYQELTTVQPNLIITLHWVTEYQKQLFLMKRIWGITKYKQISSSIFLKQYEIKTYYFYGTEQEVNSSTVI